MNQASQKPEQQQRRKAKVTFRSRTLPCKVTLRGLIVCDHRHTPADLKNHLIQWDRITIPDYYAWVKTSESDDAYVLASGHRLRLKFANNRAVRVALRTKHRHLNRAWHNGEVSVNQEFSISKQTNKRFWTIICVFTLACLALGIIFFLPLLQDAFLLIDQSTLPLQLLIGVILLCLIPFIGYVLVLRSAVSKFNVTDIKLNTEGLEVELLDGGKLSKSWYEVSSFRKCGLRYEINCTDGDKLKLPASRSIIPIIELIQKDFFPECVKKEARATRRFIIRSCILLVGGCMISAGLLSYLQSVEPTATNGPGPVATLLLIGLAAPASLILIMWLATTFDPHIRERVRRKKSWSIKL